MYISQSTLRSAITQLTGTAGEFLRIWFVLKQMGMHSEQDYVDIDTSNSTAALKELFGYGHPDDEFFVPFAPSRRFLTMKKDASRSIIQTNIRRWATSGSVVTCDPTEFLDIRSRSDGKLRVSMAQGYPLGLGYGEEGFAVKEDARVSLPLPAFAVWYGRTTCIPQGQDPETYLVNHMTTSLGISNTERQLIFVPKQLTLNTKREQLSDREIYEICTESIQGEIALTTKVIKESYDGHSRKVRSMITNIEKPKWLRTAPEQDLKEVLEAGAKAILLYGPPRTGKTRIIDQIVARDSDDRETIQIHDGWGYDNLVQGLKPDSKGNWSWEDGPLKKAIQEGKKFIVLEEINRTQISQSFGEVFSLIEDAYRGENFSITLRDGTSFYVPEDVIFVMTMNTLDKSTEEVDDALMGRIAAIEFPPRAEDLGELLANKGMDEEFSFRVAEVYAEILKIYPLGHGYFSGLERDSDNLGFISYYKSRVRPVLYNFFGDLKRSELDKVDTLVDQKFSG